MLAITSKYFYNFVLHESVGLCTQNKRLSDPYPAYNPSTCIQKFHYLLLPLSSLASPSLTVTFM